MTRHSFFCIDGHTCGNPVRLVAGGGPQLHGATMIEKRAHFIAEFDWIRTGLMFEPRGHDIMSGSILYPPTRHDCDIAILFIETSGCLPMCGHGTIGTVTMALEHGLVTPKEPGILRLDTPAGVVVAEFRRDGQYVEEVAHHQCPVLPALQPGWKSNVRASAHLVVDVAYGGNFYAIVEPQENFRDIADFSASQLACQPGDYGGRSTKIFDFVHPEKPEIRGLSHILWTGVPTMPARDRPQRGVLWRQGDRPFALRHRHFGQNGAMGRKPRAPQRRRRIYPRIDHRFAVPRPCRGKHHRWQPAGHCAVDCGVGPDDRLQHDLHR